MTEYTALWKAKREVVRKNHPRTRQTVLVTKHPVYGEQIWTGGRLSAQRRQTDKCAYCGGVLMNFAYRPVTNRKNRGDRICHVCFARAWIEVDTSGATPSGTIDH